MDKCLVLNKIQFDNNVIDFFINNKSKIIRNWTMYPTLFDILNEFDISHEYYKNNVATPVYEYFITIVKGENEPGDCPVMRNIIEIFYEKGFAVEDVFLSCTAFKNVLHTKLCQEKIDPTMIINLMMILDANLSSILSIYSHKMEEKEALIRRHNEIIENHMLLTITDEKGKINHVTDAFSSLSGYTKEELLGKTHKLMGDPNESSEFFNRLWETISSGETWNGKITNYTKDRKPFILNTTIIPVQDDNGNIVEYMAIRENITDREVFQYDTLTKVYTRRIFDEKIIQFFHNAQWKKQHFSIILADIDHFKKINDTYGHNLGDKVLQQFAEIVEKNIRHNDMCFRWGGEEFVVLLPYAKLDVAKNVAERIRIDFSEEVHIQNNFQSASFGVTDFKIDDDKDSLFKRVDQALYQAKQNGRNQVVVQ